jgi:hypothetical protein
VTRLVEGGQGTGPASPTPQHRERRDPPVERTDPPSVQRDPPADAPATAPIDIASDPHAADDPPPRYAPLAAELLRLLARSVGVLAEFGTAPRTTLWAYLDGLEAAHLATLVQLHAATRQLGVWDHITRLRHVYFGSSWGIDFEGDAAAVRSRIEGDRMWCKDLQRFVRPEHGNTRHDWWRNTEHPGERGLHVGLDAGEGWMNLHYDSHVPALGRYENDVTIFPMEALISAALGCTCRYDLLEVYSHNRDIHSTGGHDFPAPFSEIPRMRYVSDKLAALAEYEINDPFGDAPVAVRLMGTYVATRRDLDAFDEESRRLAVQPGGEDQAQRQGMADRARAVQARLLAQAKEMAGFITDHAAGLPPGAAPVDLRGAAAAQAVAGWNDLTTHTADDLAGSYFSLGQVRRDQRNR